jgi:uncharacterized protein YcaQ
MTYSFTKDGLCSFLIRYHSLDCFDKLAGESGIITLFRRIGSVQYDPLNVVGRNPHLVLQSRIKNFTMDILDKLLYQDRVLVDAWDKEMSIYRTEDWPYFKRIRKCMEESRKHTLAWRGQSEVLSYTSQVLKKLKDSGPLGATDIDLGKCRPGRWGHRKIAGAAFDYLFSKGELGVYKKRNTQKTYDLIQNLLPERIIKSPDPFDSNDDFYEWYFLRRIKSIGVHWLRNGGGWNGYYLSDSRLRKQVFDSLEKKGLIERIEIPEINETFYICQQDMDLFYIKPEYDNYARVLAPLDNLLWDRMLIQKVFDFQYSWEVYLPEEKRKYGYYVLPILYRNKIIARMEPVQQKTGNPLRIKNWWWEPNIKITKKLRNAIENGLKKFAGYLNADGIDRKALQMIFVTIQS